MFNRALGFAFITACGLGSAAQAADLTVNEQVVEAAGPVFTWTGFYAGVHAGYGWADLETDITRSFDGGDQPDGFFGGGQIGYNYQFANQVVLGIEADASFADLKDDRKFRDTNGDLYMEFGPETRITALGTVRARAGYAVDRFLPYVTGGFAWANAKSGLGVGTNVPDFPVFGFSDSHVFTGWTVGAGVEYAVTNNITAKVEYLYADLGSKDFSADLGGSTAEYRGDLSSLQTVKFGLNYKF